MKFGRNTIVLILILLTIAVGGYISSSKSPSSFQLNFPETADLGELWLVEDVNCFTCGNGEKNLGRAIGIHEITLPAPHWFVSLRMPKDASHLLPYLTNPSLTPIGDLQLQGSDVKDEDLHYIAEINLRSINLSKTKITGAGLEYLKPNETWISVDLTNCDTLQPEYLSHFRGWKQSTIRLTANNRGEDSNTEKEARLLDHARLIICDGQSESACGTQIR